MPSDDAQAVGINVASQTKYYGRGPIYSDGTFEYIPIPEKDDQVEWPTYADLNREADILSDYKDDVAHFDPEFPEVPGGEHYTYGDPGSKKRQSLERLSKGDYVFFYATLDYQGVGEHEYWINRGWGGYIIGHFKLAVDPIIGEDAYEAAPDGVKEQLANNAHLRRTKPESDIVFLIGDPTQSRLYKTAVPLTFPARSLDPAAKANHILDLPGTTPKGVWYRGPIEFDNEVTELLLQMYEDGGFAAAMGPPVTEYPGFPAFEEALGPPDSFNELRSYLADHELTEEERLLTSFLYVTAGWSTDVIDAVFETVSQPLEGPDDIFSSPSLSEQLTETFELLRGSQWPHNHRTNIPRAAGRLRESKNQPLSPYITEVVLNAIESLANQTDSLAQLITTLEQGEFSFDKGMSQLKQISSYSRLAAFDQLEVFIRVNQREKLAPQRLKKDYIDSSGPKKGFEHVFEMPLIDTPTERSVQYLTQLVAYACEEQGMSPIDAVFAVESALCNCQKGMDSYTEQQDSGINGGDDTPDVDRSDWNC